jgi:tRNA-splicing ligase RtcB
MSRTAAAGRRRRRLACPAPGCGYVQGAGEPRPAACPRCGTRKLSRRRVLESEGLIDWPAARADLRERGIELRGGAADEAPGAYKRLDRVLAAHGATVEVLHRLRPIGVAMAGPEVQDPYKD